MDYQTAKQKNPVQGSYITPPPPAIKGEPFTIDPETGKTIYLNDTKKGGRHERNRKD